jgi:hypothetical protein
MSGVVFHGLEMGLAVFSKVWKTPARTFPSLGKNDGKFSEAWKPQCVQEKP